MVMASTEAPEPVVRLGLAGKFFARRSDFWAALSGALLGTLVAAAAYFLVLERFGVGEALFLRELVPHPTDRTLIGVALIGKTALLGSVPAALFAILVTRHRRMWASGVYLVALWLCFFFLVVDLRLYLLHGRHLLQILAYATLPEGHHAGGAVALWLTRFAVWAVQAAGLALCGLGFTLLASQCCSRIPSRALRAMLALLLAIGTAGVGPTALKSGAGWRGAGLQARLLGVLPLSFGAERMIRAREPSDPVQAELQRRLNAVYQQKFSYVFRRRQPSNHAPIKPKVTPNIFLILVESLRADVFTAELMPQLHGWAQLGVRRSRHYSGTNFSESGTFSILYGLNALVYHAVLDSRIPPPLCEGLRSLSYVCAYYTGHPTVWWRREEFLGPDTFDIHERTQQGPWSEWDQNALAAFSGLANRAAGGGHLGVAFLMSTHYEYRYPPEFERFVPANEPKVSWRGSLADADFASLGNRYKNAVGFVDHILGKTLRSIDIERDYVIVTGDHAEALGEHGKIGHGFDFSDPLVHVPFVLRGPGIAAQQLGGISLHQDIWPTVLSLVTGAEPAEHDLRRESLRRGVLMAHCEFDPTEADALLLHDEVRVRIKLALWAPEVSVIGFEDAQGRPIHSPPLSDERLADLVAGFDRYLDDAAKPVLVAR